jgi:hypothetical protein
VIPPPQLGRLKEYERHKEQYANRPYKGITKTWARPDEALGTPAKQKKSQQTDRYAPTDPKIEQIHWHSKY